MTIEIAFETGPSPDNRRIEIVERKGLGHPDTICDLLSERFSVALSKYYLDHFGLVLHHNVDKALLSAGRTEPAFGGGRIVTPLRLYLAGRATADVKGVPIPVADIARGAAEAWFRNSMHAFDVEKGLELHCLTQPGSPDLVDLFLRQRETGAFLANDTSIGVGFAPFSELERIVLAVEALLNAPSFKATHLETGEDIKVMGTRLGGEITLTIACAFIGRFLADLSAYRDAAERLRGIVLDIARAETRREVRVAVNSADDLAAGTVYLTVGGTSGECGDDGETGRGNRASGLITPLRPTTLEAMAGKNPITHVGKLYNAAAMRVAGAVAAEIAGVTNAECYFVSQIGKPIDEPSLAHVRIWLGGGGSQSAVACHVREIAEREIATIPDLWRAFLKGEVAVA